jgi:hypothetical protein
MLSQDAEAQRYIEEIYAKPDNVDANTFTKHFVSTRSKYGVWRRYKDTRFGSFTIQQLYLEYIRQRFLLTQEADTEDFMPSGLDAYLGIAFKSPAKRRNLMKQGYIDSQQERLPHWFPLKASTKKYALHHVAQPNTWNVDVVFFGRFAYYAFINMNTRFLYMIPANARINEADRIGQLLADAREATGMNYYVEALHEFLPKHPHAVLRGDAEGAFATSDARIQSLYNQYGASFVRIGRLSLNTRRKQKTAPYHSSLAVLDSVVRTLRNMAYNVGLGGDVDPLDMRELVQQYNEAPHSTLTHYGPGFPISPPLAQKDSELESYICRELTRENMEVRRQQGFDLAVGTRCTVYNDISPMDKRRSATRPEIFSVVQYRCGRYRMKGEHTGSLIWLPRWKVNPIDP